MRSGKRAWRINKVSRLGASQDWPHILLDIILSSNGWIRLRNNEGNKLMLPGQ